MSIREQVKELRDCVHRWQNFEGVSSSEPFKLLSEAADTIEFLSEKLQSASNGRLMEDCGGWIPCSEPPKHNNEVLIFNGKSYSVGYYDGKTWVNVIHPAEWQEINHGSECETL